MGPCQSGPAGLGSAALTSDGMDDLCDTSQHKPSRSNYVWIRNEPLSSTYEVSKQIGLGSMGEVSIVQKKSDSGSLRNLSVKDTSLYACKTVAMLRMSSPQITEFKNEIEILRDLDHPNIVQLYECFIHQHKIYLIMDLCKGGDIGERVLNEIDTSNVIRQIFEALQYLHLRRVAHRDLKLENVMFVGDGIKIKLIDFGLSERYVQSSKMKKACGTIYTASPEVITGQTYTTQTDVWSAGVCLWCLLVGEVPFLKEMEDLQVPEKVEKLKKAQYTFKDPKWTQISSAGRSLISYCLRAHPGSRYTSKECLSHINDKWIPSLTSPPPSPSKPKTGRKRINSVMLRSFENFSNSGALKKKILMTMAYTMEKSGLEDLDRTFSDIDVNNEGTISVQELRSAIKDKNMKYGDVEVDNLFKGLDYDHSGQIHYKEFLAAAMESQNMITAERLLETFDRMDEDNSGCISRENLRSMLGKDWDESAEEEMFQGKDGIDFDTFLKVVKGQTEQATK
ncbi:hypothetical protein TrST_g665 [Triparma strigata]|uniref:Calmodulin n=2 Tax=Triparma strigata TaxID=1606541 RepID=A0A9W7AMC1_9STRA|nr:hypothetical protein TrST_g665 [Triparma strigata]